MASSSTFDSKDLDSQEFFVALMNQCNIPEHVQDKITDKSNGWSTVNEMLFSFENDKAGWEYVSKQLVLDPGMELNLNAGNYKHSRVTGGMRRLFKEVENLVQASSTQGTTHQGASDAPVKSPQPSPAPKPISLLLQERLPPILSLSDMDNWQENFKKDYPTEVLTENNTPARDLIRRVLHQKNHTCLEWMPWTNILFGTRNRDC